MSQQFPPDQSQQSQQPATGSQSTGTQTPPQQTGAMGGPVGRQFPTRSYLSPDVRSTSIGILNQCLADLSAINLQLKDMHWNVKGTDFYQLHELFEDLSDTFDSHIDAVAERASALGGQPLGTAHDIVQQSTIPQLPRGATDGLTLLDDLAYRLSMLDATLCQQIEIADQQGDLDTADLLNEVSRDVSKALWFVEAHLQGSAAQGRGAATGGMNAGQR